MVRTQRDDRRRYTDFVFSIGALTSLCVFCSAVDAANVAVIGNTGIALDWCTFLQAHGHACNNLPTDDPGIPLTGFDIVIHMGTWTDPNGELADFMRSGKGVITRGSIPYILGIQSNTVVQAWIGANNYNVDGTGFLKTTTIDPILGSLLPGSIVGDCGDFGCSSLDDTTGHPDARVLALWESGLGPIGILRNTWNTGKSIFLARSIRPQNPITNPIILNAVRELGPPPDIPTVSAWGVAAMALLLLAAGSVVVRKRGELSVVSDQKAAISHQLLAGGPAR